VAVTVRIVIFVTDTSAKEQENKDTKVRKEGHGAFFMLPHYMKLYDIVKGAYANYKVCQHFVCNANDVVAHILCCSSVVVYSNIDNSLHSF